MKITYELIKSYPGSPPIGTIATRFLKDEIHCKMPNDYEHIYHDSFETIVVSNPDFWKKVDQRDYEILSFKNLSFGTIWIKAQDGKFYPEKGHNRYDANTNFMGTPESWFLLFPKLWVINSVKRLLNNEVFTVGDKIQHTITKEIKIIEAINLDDNISIRIQGNNTSAFWALFQNIKKIEKLFTTEDKVDIYEKDIMYYVNTNDRSLTNTYADSQYNYYVVTEGKYFSTKEKAKEYLQSLKPKVIFKTFDNVEITDEKQRLYSLLPKGTWDMKSTLSMAAASYSKTPWIFFSTEKARNEYLFNNKPCLSLNDVYSIYKTAKSVNRLYPNSQGSKMDRLVRNKLFMP